MRVTKAECSNDEAAKNGAGASDVIRRHRVIDWIHVRHEEVAASVAGGKAHRTTFARVVVDAIVDKTELAMPPSVTLEKASLCT
jgi:hypothetical protein